MGTNQKNDESGVININPPQPQPANPIMDLLSNKRVKELVFSIAEKQIKEAAGIESAQRVNNKTPFGRTLATIKDFIQGTWWIVVLGTLCMGLVIIVLKFLSKMVGV